MIAYDKDNEIFENIQAVRNKRTGVVDVLDANGDRLNLVSAAVNPLTGTMTGLVGPDGTVLIRPVSSYTWTTRPAAADYSGYTIRITDVGGSAGSLWISDGAYWKPVGGRVTLASSAVQIATGSTTAEELLASIIIPAGIMSTDGRLQVWVTAQAGANDANAKNIRVRMGGVAGTLYLASTVTSARSARWMVEIQNRGATNSQIGTVFSGNASLGTNSNPIATSAIDTSVATTVVIQSQKAVGTDVVTLDAYLVELVAP